MHIYGKLGSCYKLTIHSNFQLTITFSDFSY